MFTGIKETWKSGKAGKAKVILGGTAILGALIGTAAVIVKVLHGGESEEVSVDIAPEVEIPTLENVGE